MDNPLTKLTKRQRPKIKLIIDEKVDITTYIKEIQGIIKEYFKILCTNSLKNLEEMGTFLDTFDLPKLNQEDINHLNRAIASNDIKAIIMSLPRKKSPGPKRLTSSN
jgi:hypothetical protein